MDKKRMVKLFLLFMIILTIFLNVIAVPSPITFDTESSIVEIIDFDANTNVGVVKINVNNGEYLRNFNFDAVYPEGVRNSEEIEYVRLVDDTSTSGGFLSAAQYVNLDNYWAPITRSSDEDVGAGGEESGSTTDTSMCVPWQVSVEGSSEICGQCDDNGDCGEYECRSLGQKCRWFSENCLYCLEGDEDRDGVCDERDNDISIGIPTTPDQTGVESATTIIFIDPDITRGAAGIVKRIQNDQNNFVVNIRVDGRGTESCEYNSGSGFRPMIPKSQLEISPLFFMTETIPFNLDLNYMNIRFRCGDKAETLNVIRNQLLQINFPRFFDFVDNDDIVSEDDVAHEFIVSSTTNELIRCEYSLGDGVVREFPNDCSGNPNCLWKREHRASIGEFFERDGNYNVQISCKNFKEVPEVDDTTYAVTVNANLLRFNSLDYSVRGNPLERRITGVVNGGEGQNVECRYWKMDGVRSEDEARRTTSNVRYESSWLLADSSEISNVQKTGDKTYSISQDLPRLNGEDTYYGVICRDSSNHDIQVSGFVSIIDYVTSLAMTISNYDPSQAFSDVVITTSGGLNNNGLARCWYKNIEADSFEDVNWEDAVLIGENQNSFSFRLPQTGYFERELNPYYFKCEDVNLANNFDWERKDYNIVPSDDNRLEIIEVICEDCNSNDEGGLSQEWVLRTEKGVRNGDATCQYTCPWTEGPANFDSVEYLTEDGVKLHKKTFEIDGETIINNKAYSCTFECSNGIEEDILPKSMSFKTPALRVIDFGLFSDANGENKIADGGTIGFEDAYLIVKTKGGLDGNGNAECRVTNGLLDSLIIVEGGRERHNFFNDVMRDVLRSRFGSAGWILNTMTQGERIFVSEEEAKIHRYKLPKEILQEASNGDAKNYNYWIQCRDVDFRGRYAVRVDGEEKLSNLVMFNVDFRDLIIKFVKPADGETSEGRDVELEFNVRGGTTFGNLLTEGRVSSCRVDNLLTGENGVKSLNGDDRNVARRAFGAPNDDLMGRKERMTVFNTVLNDLEEGEHAYRVVCSDLNSKSVGSSEILFETEIKNYEVTDNWDEEDTIIDNFEWSLIATGGNKGYGGGECTYSIDGTSASGRFTPNDRDQVITPFNANIDVSGLDGVYTFRAECSDDGFDSDHTDDKIFVHRGILVERGVEAGIGQCGVGVIFAGNVDCLCRSTRVTSSDFGKYCCESGNVVNSVNDCPAVCVAENCKPLGCSNYENFESCRNIVQGVVECNGVGSCCVGSCNIVRISPLQISGLSVGPKNVQNEIGTNKPEIKFRLIGGKGNATCYYGGEFGDVNANHLFNKRAISATEWEYTKQFYEELTNRNYGQGEYVVWCDETGVVGDSEEISAFRVNVIRTCSEADGVTYAQQCSVLRKDNEVCDVVGGSVGSNEYCCETGCIVPTNCADVALDASQGTCIDASCKWSGDTLKCGATCQGNLVEGTTTGLCEVPPVVCDEQSDCPACVTNPYCEDVAGSGKHLCTPSRVKQQCVGGVCSASSCPTSGFNTDYCQVTPDPLCLSDVDGDNVADSLDCNDVSTSIGQCDVVQCKQCNEDSSTNNDRGICVAIPDCEPPVDCSVSSLDADQNTCISASCKWSGDTLKCGATCQGTLQDDNADGVCVQPPVVNTLDGCTIRNPRWNDLRDIVISQSFDDYIVKLKADVQNCNGLSIRFEIAENDGLFGVSIDPSVEISDITNVEVRSGVAIGEWEVDYIENADSVLGVSNDPEYVFKAVVVDSQDREKETGWSGNLNVDLSEIEFTGNSIRNAEEIAKLNDTWKVEINLRRDRDHVYVVFDRSDEISLDDNGDIIISEGIPSFEIRKSGTVYPTNRNLFLNALGLANDIAIPLGEYSYQIIVFDDDFREGKRSSVRTFNIVEGSTLTETCTDGQIRTTNCSPVSGCNTQEVCVNSIWSNSCVDVPNDNCPTDSGGSAFVISKVEPTSDVVRGPVFKLIISEDAPQEVQCRYANNLWNELESRYDDRFVPYPTFDSLTGLFSKARDAAHIHGADIPTNTLNLGDHRVFVACKAGAVEQSALISFRVVREEGPCTNGETRPCQPIGVCATHETCVNSGWDGQCVKDDLSCGVPIDGGINIAINNPSALEPFTSLPLQFNLEISTDEVLNLGQCRYAFKKDRYAGSYPGFSDMINFASVGGDGLSQSSPINLNNLFNLNGDGEYGFYVRCEKGSEYGERTGYVNVAVGSPLIDTEPVVVGPREYASETSAYISCSSELGRDGRVASASARYYCVDNPDNFIDCDVDRYIGSGAVRVLFRHDWDGGECEGTDPCPGQQKRGTLTVGCVPSILRVDTECNDGINNDPSNNNCADYLIDSGCNSFNDNDESGGSCPSTSLNQCENGVDEDGDGCRDLEDNDCNALDDDTEFGSVCGLCIPSTEICDDDRDNDCDERLDCNDASCSTNLACQTAPPGGSPGGTPVAANECTVTSIRWINLETEATISNIEEGTVVNALVEGADCNVGDTVNYEIKEKDGGTVLDSLFPDDEILGPIAVTFTVDRIMLIQWNASKQVEDITDDPSLDNSYYVKIGDVNSENINVIPRTGPVICTPSREICNDNADNDCDTYRDCYDDDCRGDSACTGQITPLIIRNMGPSSSTDFNFELFITLGGGSGGNGNAECYWDETPNPQMNLDTLIPGAFANKFNTFRNEFSGGIFNTRYYTNVIKPNGEHTFYLRCRDPNGANISLQPMTTRVNVPDANRLRILNAAPNGTTYGIRNVDVNANTAGGRGSGANVRCSYSGSGLTGNLNPVLSSGNIYTHSANIQNVPVGNNIFTITCTDDAETVTSNINFNVALDTTAPQIVQIVTSGTKYIRTNEEALCRLSTTSNVDAGADLSRDESRKIHSVITSSSYYVRCRDNWGNPGNVVKVNV